MSDRLHKPGPSSEPAAVRIDKWLWAARFFKTRSLASAAVKGGKVELDGRRVKPGAAVRAGQMLRVTKGETVFEIEIEAVSDQRGPASRAQALYTETEAGARRRAERAAERRAARVAVPRPQPSGRPDKKQRRQLRRFKHGDNAE